MFFLECDQCTSHVFGSRTLRPNAPARAHRLDSDLIVTRVLLHLGRASSSKVQVFRCFQICQAVSSVMDARPLRIGFGVARLATGHQSTSLMPRVGGWQVALIQASISYHTWRAKGQSTRMCCMVSGHWSQRTQLALCGSPCRSRRSAVQHLSRAASQKKNLARRDAHVFQVSFHELLGIEP